MASSNESTTNIVKCALVDTVMHACYIRGGSRVTKRVLRLSIRNFMLLKNGISYRKTVDACDWELEVTKKRKSTTFLIHTFTPCTFGLHCDVEYTPYHRSRMTEGNKISKNVHKVELSSDVIHDPRNSPLARGTLICMMHIASRFDFLVPRPIGGDQLVKESPSVAFRRIVRYYPPAQMDEETLTEEMMAYSRGKFCDFNIRTRDFKMSVNKAILAARSRFFAEYFLRNGDETEIELDASYVTVCSLVVFMYCGQLLVQSLETTLDIAELALKLQMLNLHSICVNYVRYLIDERNAHEIKEMAHKRGFDTLVVVADSFLASNQDLWTTNNIRTWAFG